MLANHLGSPFYCTSPQQKSKAKEAAHKFKYGSPKLRDTLRQKCRERMKIARSENFDENRSKSGRMLLEKIVREELSELEENISLQELIYAELMEEPNEWILDEYEDEMNFLSNLIDDETESVFCPICQKHYLRDDKSSSNLNCDCGQRFFYGRSLKDLQGEIRRISIKHEMTTCTQELNFMTIPECDDKKLLFADCDECSFFYKFHS